MKDRKYSDTSDAFLCDILSSKCNQFLRSYGNPKSKSFIEINQTVKFTTSQMKTTKTIVTKNKIVYSNVVSQSTIKEVALEQTQQLRRKQQQLLVDLMKHIIQNIKSKVQDILMNIISPQTNKQIFKKVVLTLECEFESINEELARVRKYTKRKEIRDVKHLINQVFNLQINSMSSQQFVQLLFSSLPTLKEYFLKFNIQVFTNQQIDQYKQQNLKLIFQLIDLDGLIQKRQKQRKQKKKNKKKIKKNKSQTGQTTNQTNQKNQQQDDCQKLDNEVNQFLQSLVINEKRITCHPLPDDWVKKMRIKYVQ